VYIEAGALALRGYNSILVGPASLIAQRNVSTSARPVVMTDTLPGTPYEGMLILLKNPVTITANNVDVTLDTDHVYEYSEGSWIQYTGVVNG
jgi:hypothetical protein